MRCTIDLDGTDFFTKWRFTVDWLVLRVLSRNAQYGRRSASGKFHLKCHGLKVSFRTSLILRLLLGDDKMRIKFDLQRLKKPKQCLFTMKNGKRAGKWSQNLLEVIR